MTTGPNAGGDARGGGMARGCRDAADLDWRDVDEVARFVASHALAEDRASRDVTTLSLATVEKEWSCAVVAREPLVVAGWPAFRAVYELLEPGGVVVEVEVDDAAEAGPGERLGLVRGPASSILRGERVALNLLCRLSGIASETRRFVRAVEGLDVQILDTRKTTPCHRALERFAVRCGGGVNHRFDLSEMAMIKDNHIAVAGWKGLPALFDRIRSRGGNGSGRIGIEVEIDRPERLAEVIVLHPERILLDNMDPPELEHCVELARKTNPEVYLEASGGITLDNVRRVAMTGVDGISIGMLTHSARSSDIGMDWKDGE